MHALTPSPSPPPSPSPGEVSSLSDPHTVIELRQYTLHPGARDTLIDVFDHHFIEGQETHGMRIIGQFRDVDRSDRFVWLRSFPDMPRRAAALEAFYTGPIWRSHRAVANATMIDSDNVLLLRPARPDSGFPLARPPLPPHEATDASFFVLNIIYLRRKTPGPFAEFFENTLKPAWAHAGFSVIAALETNSSENTFERLPVREGERVFVWVSSFPTFAACERCALALADSPTWRRLEGELSLWTHQPLETLRLAPTARSRLRGALNAGVGRDSLLGFALAQPYR